VGQPDQQGRRHHEHAHHVAQPPLQPDRGIVGERHDAAQGQGGHANERTEHRAQEGGQKDQGEDVANTVQRVAKTSQVLQQQSPYQRPRHVADADAGGEKNRKPGPGVRQKRAQEDPGSDTVAKHQNSHQRDPTRRPEECDRTADHRERQSELRGGEVQQGDTDQAGDQQSGGFTMPHGCHTTRGNATDRLRSAPVAPCGPAGSLQGTGRSSRSLVHEHLLCLADRP
jgi:hypothetical protein